MNLSAKQVLVISEGPTEAKLLQRLLGKFDLPRVEVVSLKANLKKLYLEYESYECEYSDLDITAVLRSSNQVGQGDKEKLKGKSANDFSDIFLAFDLDPHTADFDPQCVHKLMSHFCDSSDAGKLYINYPMVESFYHVPLAILDGFDNTDVEKSLIRYEVRELPGYKKRVNLEGFKYRKDHGVSLYQSVIRRHAKIVGFLTQQSIESTFQLKAQVALLKKQLSSIQASKSGYVVNTFCLLVPELYPSKCPLTEEESTLPSE